MAKNLLYLSLIAFTGPKTEPILVDPPAPRRQIVEPQQLPHGHDSSTRRS